MKSVDKWIAPIVAPAAVATAIVASVVGLGPYLI